MGVYSMQKMIMNLALASLDFIKNTRNLMKNRDYNLVHMGKDTPMVNVTREELNDYILLLELSKEYET